MQRCNDNTCTSPGEFGVIRDGNLMKPFPLHCERHLLFELRTMPAGETWAVHRINPSKAPVDGFLDNLR